MRFRKAIALYVAETGGPTQVPVLGGRRNGATEDLDGGRATLIHNLELAAHENRNLLWLVLILVCALFGLVYFLVVRSVASGASPRSVLALLAILGGLLEGLRRIWRDQQRISMLWILASNVEPNQLLDIVHTLYWELPKAGPLHRGGEDE